MVGAIKSGLGLGSADGNRDPWHGMVGDAHPLDFVEGQLSDIVIWRRAPATQVGAALGASAKHRFLLAI